MADFMDLIVYVPPVSGTGALHDLIVDGQEAHPKWIPVSAIEGNALLRNPDGLYAAPGGSDWPGISDFPDNIAVLHETDGKVYVPAGSAFPGISDDDPNCLVLSPTDSKLFVKCIDPADLISDCEDNGLELGDDGKLCVTPCECELELTMDDLISQDGNNCLIEGGDGKLFVNCTPDIKISTDENNCLVKGSDDGLFVECGGGGGGGWPGISDDEGNIVTLGSDNKVFAPDTFPGLSELPDSIAQFDDDGKIFVPSTGGSVDAPSWQPLYWPVNDIGEDEYEIQSVMPSDATRISIVSYDSDGATDNLTVSIRPTYSSDDPVYIPNAGDTPLSVIGWRDKAVTMLIHGFSGSATSVSALMKLEG